MPHYSIYQSKLDMEKYHAPGRVIQGQKSPDKRHKVVNIDLMYQSLVKINTCIPKLNVVSCIGKNYRQS